MYFTQNTHICASYILFKNLQWVSNVTRTNLKPITRGYMFYMTWFLFFLLVSFSLRMTFLSLETHVTPAILAFWLCHDHIKLASSSTCTLSTPSARCPPFLDLPCRSPVVIPNYMYLRPYDYLKFCWLFLVYCFTHSSLLILKVSSVEAGNLSEWFHYIISTS